MAQQALSASPSDQETLPFRGLSQRQVASRRESGLGNDVDFDTSRPYRQILRENLLTFFNVVLFGIGFILLLLGSPRDAFFTISVALLNVVIATFQEVQAKHKLDQISLLARPKISVIRQGKEEKVDPREIVQGDLLVVESGDQIVADGEVIGDGQIAVDESLLTGEADLVTKQAGDSVLSGSFCVTGRAVFEARKVGQDSFANQLAQDARTFSREYTPLQQEVDLIIRILLLVVAFFGVLITLSFFINEETTLLASARSAAVVFGLAPSSLFLTIVVAYAMGALRIANKGALVQQANSVESLCHVTALCLDKTGTLTSNRIRLKESQVLNNTQFTKINLEEVLGTYARTLSSGNRTLEALAAEYPGEKRPFHEEVLFASERRWSGLSFSSDNDLSGTFVLGAPEVLEPHLAPNNDAGSMTDLMGSWSSQGLRVLLFAYRPEVVPMNGDQAKIRVPSDLQAACLLGFSDELRPQAQETLEEFTKTGIELKIISGDNPHTVAALARQVGLGGDDRELTLASGAELDGLRKAQFAQIAKETDIFGRITPAQKEKLIRVLRENGHYVAMTGDGVNDVLALKQANLSIAMQSGSQASRNVSDIILLNDSFAALPQAFIEGQRILNGMEDIFRLYMSRIFSLTLLIAMIAMLAVGFPFTPSQSSIISLLTLTLPAFALAYWARPGPVSQTSMTRRLIHFVLPAAITMSIAGLIIYLYFSLTTQDASYAQLTLTYAMIGMGLFLVVFVEPPTAFWVGGDEYSGDARPTLLVIGLFLAFIAALTLPTVRNFTGLMPLRQTRDYLIIGVVTVIWIFSLRRTWRSGIIDRYLNLRPKAYKRT